MKKISLFLTELFLSIICFAQSSNPIVSRLSSREIAECKTPASIAYNFILACLDADKDKMINMSTGEFQDAIRYNFADVIDSFSNPEYDKLRIYDWLPIPAGCEIAVLYVQTETPLNYPKPFKKVYINVVPSNEIGNTGFQDITRMFNTNVKVMLYDEGNGWKVTGFK